MFTNADTQKAAQNVVDFIIQNPNLHEQASYFGERKHHIYDDEDDFSVDDTTTWSCDTTMCIAGTVLMQKYGGKVALSRFVADDTASVEEAGLILGLEDVKELNSIFMDMSNNRAFSKMVALAEGDLEKFKEL